MGGKVENVALAWGDKFEAIIAWAKEQQVGPEAVYSPSTLASPLWLGLRFDAPIQDSLRFADASVVSSLLSSAARSTSVSPDPSSPSLTVPRRTSARVSRFEPTSFPLAPPQPPPPRLTRPRVRIGLRPTDLLLFHCLLRPAGIQTFGPSPAAAQMEGSKAFSKEFMARHAIPTAAFRVFKAEEFDQACTYAKECGHRVVLKADGLAGGKGVLIPETWEETEAGLRDVMVNKVFGSAGASLSLHLVSCVFCCAFLSAHTKWLCRPAGAEIVIEEYLEGPEVSVLAFSDGYTIRALPAAQDHKRIGDGDQGPNTGGMGAYAPAPIATKEILAEIQKSLEQTISGMRKDGEHAVVIS